MLVDVKKKKKGESLEENNKKELELLMSAEIDQSPSCHTIPLHSLCVIYPFNAKYGTFHKKAYVLSNDDWIQALQLQYAVTVCYCVFIHPNQPDYCTLAIRYQATACTQCVCVCAFEFCSASN